MPSIDITQEQADALARGETVSISPKPKTYKNVFVRPKDGGKALYILLEGTENSGSILLSRYLYVRDTDGRPPDYCANVQRNGWLPKEAWEVKSAT